MSDQSVESVLSIASLARLVADEDEISGALGFYELVKEIGHGSFSQVYEAIDSRDGSRVAVKVFNSNIGGDGFVREVGLAMGLSHPNLLSALDLGYAVDKKRYVVYQLAQGGSLRRKIKKGNISRAFISNYITQIARGLRVLHNKSVVHRDIKPENMLFDNEGPYSHLRLTDWGTAEIVSKQQAKGETGSPAYMSPEQINGSCDTRADIYSVGVIAYELFFGRRPFLGAPVDVLRGHLKENAVLTDISEELKGVFQKVLAKKPAERYQTIEDFLFEFDAALLSKNLLFTRHFSLDKEKTEIAVDNLSGWTLNREADFLRFEGDNTPKIKFEVVGAAKAALSSASLIQFAIRDDKNLFCGFENKVMQFPAPLYGMPPIVAIRQFNSDVWTINGASNPTLTGRNYLGEIVKEIRLTQNLSDILSFNHHNQEHLLGIDLNRKSLFFFDGNQLGASPKTVKFDLEIKSVSVAEEKILVETVNGAKHLVQDEFA
jgi:serine/threonine protein kinase